MQLKSQRGVELGDKDFCAKQAMSRLFWKVSLLELSLVIPFVQCGSVPCSLSLENFFKLVNCQEKKNKTFTNDKGLIFGEG